MIALIAIVSGFASGIFFRSLFFNSWWPVFFILLMVAIIYFVPKLLSVYSLAPLENESSSSLMGLAVLFFIFVALGLVRSTVADTPLPTIFTGDLKHRVAYEGIVVGDPDVREKNQRIALVVEKGDERVGALAVMPLKNHVSVGDRIRVYGTLSLPQAFETENGRTFRYDKYLEARGSRFLIQFGAIYTTEEATWYSLPAALARIKHSFLDGLNRALPKPDSALAGGIVIGGKQGLGTELQDAFTRSGLVQIIVLSGYNVMIVAEWVMIFFAYCRLPRKIQFFAGGAALLLFVGIAGISATAVRAAIMAGVALYARATGQKLAARRALLFTVLVMLIWNPLYLVFDPGFGLSVAATAGIICLAPLFEVRFSRLWPFLRNVVATTLAAQVSVLPLLLYDIGLFSLVALPANILVNPLVPLAMASAAIAGVVGMILGPFMPIVTTIVGYPAYVLTSYFIFIAEKSSALPFAAFNLPLFSFWLVLIAYAILVYFVRRLADQKRLSITDQFKLAKKASI